MKSRVRQASWLIGIAVVGALAWVTFEPHDDGHEAAAEPGAMPLALPASAAVAASPAPLPASPVAVASPPAAEPALAPTPPDISRKQREIQLAISSDQRSMARVAADHIQACLALERMRDSGANSRLTETQKRAFLESMSESLLACQAIDATSRAQLVPLLRRSLAEGDRGAAAGLVQALGERLRPQDEPELVAALRRDAWACDRSSVGWLMGLTKQHPQLLTLNETGMLRQKEREWMVARVEALRAATELDPQRKAAMEAALVKAIEGLNLPAGADAAEVARLSAEHKSSCPGMPAL